MNLKHIKLFENYKPSQSERYLYIEVFNGDGHTDPTVKIYKDSIEAHERFDEQRNAYIQLDKATLSSTGSTNPWDMTFDLPGDSGNSGRMTIEKLTPGNFYVLHLETTVCGIELHEFNTLEEATTKFNDMIDILDWEDEEEALENRNDGYVSGYDSEYYSYIEIIK